MKIQSKRGFTLVELLVVVLIIGVLASVALPLYQNAVDKSRWARLVSPARSIANAEEALHMSQGKYTAEKDDLVVSLPTDSDLSYSLYTTENGDVANFVRVESSKLDNVRLARYYRVNSDDSENVYCEAKSDNERAKKLCGKLLKGTEASTTDDGYKTYLVEGEMSTACNWWSSMNNTCYTSEQERCEAHGMTYANSKCGCVGTNGTPEDKCAQTTINEGGTCTGEPDAAYPCQQAIINNGGVCEAGGGGACFWATVNAGGECNALNDNTACQSTNLEGGTCNAGSGGGCMTAQVHAGGVCNTEAGATGGCMQANVYDGGICNGTAENGCLGAVVQAGGVCNGDGVNSCQALYMDYEAMFPGMGMPPLINGSVSGTCNGNAVGSCQGPAGHEDALVFQSGAVCNGNASGACGGTFQAGAKCYANEPGSCAGDYSQGGCCVGTHCPSGTQCS